MSDQPNVRELKIEATGDFDRADEIPLIRLRGKWLARAGFTPGDRVRIEIQAPGRMVLRALGAVESGDRQMELFQ